MGFFTNMLKVARLPGVKHYILADFEGEVIIHNTKSYQEIGAMISRCGTQTSSLAKNRLKFIVFNRKSKNDLFIFPIGKYYLGVVKHKSADMADLTENVLGFLNGPDLKIPG